MSTLKGGDAMPIEHIITQVARGGVAWKNGVKPGDALIAVDGEPILDHIDYQALTSKKRFVMTIRRASGEEEKIVVAKRGDAPMGMAFGESMQCNARACRNHCVFCFIDQMPPGLRSPLYVKDDDWRLSVMMGNYITLTNVDDAEFSRILKRKASPLYISVHAVNPETRVRMMRNPAAAALMPRLHALAESGISFHCQIVLCPGINDGEVLSDTLSQLSALYPAARSAALVPVGLTRFREGLAALTPFDGEKARAVLDQCQTWQQKCLASIGTHFVYAADELYCLAGRELPSDAEYEGYPQIENGVGLLRQFERGLREARESGEYDTANARRVLIACGASVAPVMRGWMVRYAPEGAQVTVQAIRNAFFGESVTVTGLLTGGDILAQVQGVQTDELLICRNTLRAEGDIFLDGMTLADFRAALPFPVTVVENDGEALLRALMGEA